MKKEKYLQYFEEELKKYDDVDMFLHLVEIEEQLKLIEDEETILEVLNSPKIEAQNIAQKYHYKKKEIPTTEEHKLHKNILNVVAQGIYIVAIFWSFIFVTSNFIRLFEIFRLIKTFKTITLSFVIVICILLIAILVIKLSIIGREYILKKSKELNYV